MSSVAHKIRIATHLRELKVAIADARGKFGRDFIRGLHQGKLLDALDAGRKTTHPDDAEKPDA